MTGVDSIDKGAVSGSGNYAVSADIIDGWSFQRVKLIDPVDGEDAPIGVLANPLVVSGVVTVDATVPVEVEGFGPGVNTVTVDRGNGDGQEQIVQVVSLDGFPIVAVVLNDPGAGAVNIQDGGNSITVDGQVSGATVSAAGSLAAVDDTVSVTTVGMAAATFILSGTYTPVTDAAVYFERTFDGVLWRQVPAEISDDLAAFATALVPSADRTYVCVVDVAGSQAIRVRLVVQPMDTGAIDVNASAQPVAPGLQNVRIVGSSGVNIGVSINATDTVVPVAFTTPTVETLADIALASDTTEAQVVASNAARKSLTLTNTDMNRCFLKWGAAPTDTDWHFYLDEGDRYELPSPPITAELRAVWATDGAGFLMGCEG